MKSKAMKIIIASASVMIIGEPFLDLIKDGEKGLKTYTHPAIYEYTFPYVPSPPHTHEEQQTESLQGFPNVSVAPTGWTSNDHLHGFRNVQTSELSQWDFEG